MPSDGQRQARLALDAARGSFERLTSAARPAEATAQMGEAWAATEEALRALAGTRVLEGVALVRELRQRNLLSLDDAHALIDFHAAVVRATDEGDEATAADVEAARVAHDRLRRVIDGGGDAAGAGPYSGPVSPPRTPPPPASPSLHGIEVDAPASRNTLALLLVGVALVAVAGAGVFYARRLSSEPSDLRRARAAFAAGDRVGARNAFAAVAAREPALAEPHIYLGRMAREDGDRATASAELRRAVELEPGNFLAHRELAAYLLWSGQLDLARSFYQRAIELNPTDRPSLGYMGCTLHRQGRADLAVRFFQRAGPGEWQQCQAAPPPMALPAQPPAAPR